MNEHDIVTYSERHYEWLVKAGRWPSKYLPRIAERGKVMRLLDDGLVCVLWDRGPTHCHFADNLAVLP